MRREEIRVCVLRIEGTNCEQELADCFTRLGCQSEIVHLKQFTGQDVHESERRKLADFHALMIPGGFSAGDYVRAGAIWAARVKAAMLGDLKSFVEEGYLVGGICNGFQVLVETGFLPGLGGKVSTVPEAALQTNDSDRFECRPTLLRHENRGRCQFTHGIDRGGVVMIPSAHAEGKFTVRTGSEVDVLRELDDNDQIVFRYVNPEGEPAGYPWNPNGALDNIAGICNRQGNVFGMMPHPERVFYRHQHPDWPRTGLGDDVGDGRIIFESMVGYLEKHF